MGIRGVLEGRGKDGEGRRGALLSLAPRQSATQELTSRAHNLFEFAAAARPVRTLADAVLLLHDASSPLATLLRCEVRGAHARLLHTAGLLT